MVNTVVVGCVLYAEDKDVLCKLIIQMLSDADKRRVYATYAMHAILN